MAFVLLFVELGDVSEKQISTTAYGRFVFSSSVNNATSVYMDLPLFRPNTHLIISSFNENKRARTDLEYSISVQRESG